MGYRSVIAGLFAGLIAALLGVGAVSASASDTVWTYEGRCFYADRFAPLLGEGVVFADCDDASVVQLDEAAIFRFHRSRPKRAMEFRTVRDSDKWEIEAIRLHNREWRDASGECTVYWRSGKVSTLTCITTKGAILYAANFEVASY